MKLVDLLETSPVIAAARDDEGLLRCLKSDCEVIFTLYGNVCSIPDIVEKIKAAGKTAIVHVDFIQGLSSKEIVVDFIHQNTKADGIISTRPQLVKHAMEQGMIGIVRTFLIDTIALDSTRKQLETFRPDAMEIMPGIIPQAMKKIRSYTTVPLIAGGLISEKKDILEALAAGADAISTTKEALWYS